MSDGIGLDDYDADHHAKDITNKKLADLKSQTETILDTLIEGEMNTVFTNDSKYLSARDELLAVRSP